MICSKCGSQVPDGMKFCTNCGAPLEAAAAPVAAAPVAAPQVEEIGATMPVAPAAAPTPVASAPVAPAPAAPTPAAAPVYAQPAAPTPVAPQPAYAQPAAPTPVAPQPAYAQPAAPTPVAPQPAYAQPAAPTPVAPQPAYAQPTAAPVAPKKKSKVGLIIGIAAGSVVLLAGIAVGAFLFLNNRPIVKAQKALADGNISEAVGYYEEMSEADQEKFKSQLMDAVEDYSKQYEDGDLKKSKFEKILDQAEEILEDEDDFAEIQQSVKGIVGTWEATVDLGKVFGYFAGMDDFDGKVDVTWTMIFDEDGKLESKVVFKDEAAALAAIVEAMTEYLYDMYRDMGYSTSDIDDEFMAYYGMTLEEYVEEEIFDELSEELLDELNDVKDYSFEDGVLIIDYEETRYELKGSTLLLYGDEDAEEVEIYGDIFPIEFTRK